MVIYKTGNGPQQIDLTVDISTIGMAATRALVGKPGPGNPQNPVAHSADATGDIPMSPIGSAANLQGQSLFVSTLINLNTILNQPDREAEFNKLTAAYILDNGIDGHKIFTVPDTKVHSSDFTTVILFIQIDLTA